jgi:hypothetical protein
MMMLIRIGTAILCLSGLCVAVWSILTTKKEPCGPGVFDVYINGQLMISTLMMPGFSVPQFCLNKGDVVRTTINGKTIGHFKFTREVHVYVNTHTTGCFVTEFEDKFYGEDVHITHCPGFFGLSWRHKDKECPILAEEIKREDGTRHDFP